MVYLLFDCELLACIRSLLLCGCCQPLGICKRQAHHRLHRTEKIQSTQQLRPNNAI